MFRKLLLFPLLLLALPAFAQFGDELITTTDLLQIRQLGDVTLSPDGRYVAYTVREIVEDGEDDYSYRTRLFVVPTDASAEARPLTAADRDASAPAWHPESDNLVFTRRVGGKPQLFLLPLTGGEAQQLTSFAHGASSPRYSPNGRFLLFSAFRSDRDLAADGQPEWPSERPGRTPGDATAEPDPDGSLTEIRAWLEQNAADDNPKVLTRLDFQGETDLDTRLSFSHLYVLDMETGEAWPVPTQPGFYSYGGGTWLDDNTILFSAHRSSQAHPDLVRESDLWLVRRNGSGLRRLISLDGYRLFNPVPSPDKQYLSFLAQALDEPSYAQTRLAVWSLRGDSLRYFSDDFDRSVGGAQWSENGWYVYFTAASDGGFPLYRVQLFDAPQPDSVAADTLSSLFRVERLTEFDTGIRSFDVGEGTVAFVLTEVANPYELYAGTLSLREPQRLTEHNASWLKDKRLSFPRKYQLQRDSLTIDYWIMRPTRFDSREKYPLLLNMHGGPSAMWGPGEASMWHEFQLMAARGYGIVYANPRGSGGYGFDFQKANYRDWGTGPAGDVLAAEAAAAEEPWVDQDKRVITGGSYAGYLTAWIVAHDDRFRAAVAQRGVYDLAVFLGEGNAWRLVPNHFGGYPWEPEVDSVLTANSPLTFVENIRTPLLIIHGDNDRRTGFIQSEMLYRALKLLERPVEYIRYPGGSHELSRSGDPKQRMDRLLRIYEFMERFIHTPPREIVAEE